MGVSIDDMSTDSTKNKKLFKNQKVIDVIME